MELNSDRLMHTIGGIAVGALIIKAMQTFAPEVLASMVEKVTGFF